MQTPNDNHAQESGLTAPPRLISALKQVSGRGTFIPPTVDESVLRVARRHLDRPQRGRLISFRFMPWAIAAGAAAVVIGLLAHFGARWNSPASRQPAYAREDLNRDGRVDMLDAFVLARQIKTGRGAAAPGLDLNGDGAVDERDAAVIAAHSVRLEKGGRS
jgi:hypothetical protein